MINPFRFRPHWLELSDYLLDIDVETLERRPVEREAVFAALRQEGNPYGRRILEGVPGDRHFDDDAVDALLVRCHRELQRLALELQTGARTAALLRAILPKLNVQGPVRIVDVGCGIGYVLRWMAAHSGLQNVEFIGCDFNGALIDEAQRLTAAEALPVRFLRQDAFRLDVQAHVFLSTGVIHHIPAEQLPAFFGAQVEAGAQAFLHADFQASPLAPIGSWMFHVARMREPLAVHDGILSAVRAHPREVLMSAAQATGRSIHHLGAHVLPGIPRAMHAVAMLPWC